MKINKKQKELIKIFLFLIVLSFIIVNWDSISWAFNYREMSGLVYDFFNPYQDSNLLVSANDTIVPAAAITTNNSPNTQVPATATVVSQNIGINFSDPINTLSISSIGVNTPVVIGESTDITTLEKDLDKGAVYYPGSVLPGQNGQIIILGHSAPPGWPPIKHDYIFTDIQKLAVGDQIVLNFNNTPYTYKVISKQIIAQGQDLGIEKAAGSSNVLTLVSCWPPGKDYKRIAVSAQLVKN